MSHKPLTSALRVALIATFSIGLAAATAWSVLIGYTDYRAQGLTVEGTEKALALVPGNAAYHFQLAVLVSETDSKTAAQAFQRSVALNPFDARPLIELGLRAEQEGQFDSAERYFLRAAEVNNQYLPKWSLTNYYFRRSNMAKFWLWAKQAVTMLYGDPLPMFRLCGMIVEDGTLMDRLDIRNANIEAAYLSYLLARNRVDLVRPAALRLLNHPREQDIAPLLSTCDRLIDANLVDDALAIWNSLAKSRGIAVKALEPGADGLMVHDDFSSAPTSEGFDWRLPRLEGVSASLEESPSGLRILFSGKQAETCETLYRFVPVRENAEYAFTVHGKADGIQPGSGLVWRVADARGGTNLAEFPAVPSGDGSAVEGRFVTPSGCRMLRLTLAYARARGTIRIDGSIVLREATLKRGS